MSLFVENIRASDIADLIFLVSAAVFYSSSFYIIKINVSCEVSLFDMLSAKPNVLSF